MFTRNFVGVGVLVAVALLAGCGSGSSTIAARSAGTETPGPSPSASPTSPLSPPGVPGAKTATITNTGSTNTLGYTLTVTLNADGTVTPATIPPSLAVKLFMDLDTVNPVSSLPQEFCAKSVSFGSSTYIEYNGSTSPDLQCQFDSAIGQTLETDVEQITQALNLGGPRYPVTP